MAKILFIEDEEYTMQSFIWKLQDANHQVIVVKGGEESIRCLKGGKHDFALIILDIMLPRGNDKGSPTVNDHVKTGEMGKEVLRQLREEMNDQTPVIVLTAVKENDLKVEILKYGVEEYFTKPISLTDFVDAVEKVLSSATLH